MYVLSNIKNYYKLIDIDIWIHIYRLMFDLAAILATGEGLGTVRHNLAS